MTSKDKFLTLVSDETSSWLEKAKLRQKTNHMTFIEELRWRGLLHDITPGLEEELNKGEMMTAYIGYDPTASSLTIGNLVTIMLLRIFQNHGHKPIVVIGGATAMIGDPSGKNDERQLLDRKIIQSNTENQCKIFEKLLDFNEEKNSAEIFDNNNIYSEYLFEIKFLDFLRDVGKYFTINYMLSKDSVKNRMETGISFTEFSYQLLQAYDFYYLYYNKKCDIQMGGSDQWGNITSGIHLIDKKGGHKGYGLTCPLLVKSDGTKFGKSEKGNIWLDENLTTPYQFYQFWFNCSDEDIMKYNRIFTLKSAEETEKLEKKHLENLGSRILQDSLGKELTIRIHGAKSMFDVACLCTFLHDKRMNHDDIKTLYLEKDWERAYNSIPHYDVPFSVFKSIISLKDLLVNHTNVFNSYTEYNRALKQKSLYVQKKLVDYDSVNEELLIHGKYLLVENGKQKYIIKFI